jgi:energy-coupling factor transporter ATP-binding protein EcfA2
MSNPAIEADALRKAFGQVTALDGLSFQVPAGSVLGLLGPNGSGKTTAVSILSTSLWPDAGRAAVCGLDVLADAPAVRRLIGFAGQFAAVNPEPDRPGEPGADRPAVAGGPPPGPGLGFATEEGAEAARTVLDSQGYRPERSDAQIAVRSAAGSGELTRVLRALGSRAPDPVSVAVREPALDDVLLALTGAGQAAAESVRQKGAAA